VNAGSGAERAALDELLVAGEPDVFVRLGGGAVVAWLDDREGVLATDTVFVLEPQAGSASAGSDKHASSAGVRGRKLRITRWYSPQAGSLLT
jgi:hypothetical protein